MCLNVFVSTMEKMPYLLDGSAASVQTNLGLNDGSVLGNLFMAGRDTSLKKFDKLAGELEKVNQQTLFLFERDKLFFCDSESVEEVGVLLICQHQLECLKMSNKSTLKRETVVDSKTT